MSDGNRETLQTVATLSGYMHISAMEKDREDGKPMPVVRLHVAHNYWLVRMHSHQARMLAAQLVAAANELDSWGPKP